MDEKDQKLSDIARTIDEALRLKSINEELLDTLASTLSWVLHYTAKNNIPLSNLEGLEYLLRKTHAILVEINPTAKHSLSLDFEHSKDHSENEQNPLRTLGPPHFYIHRFQIAFVSYSTALISIGFIFYNKNFSTDQVFESRP